MENRRKEDTDLIQEIKCLNTQEFLNERTREYGQEEIIKQIIEGNSPGLKEMSL